MSGKIQIPTDTMEQEFSAYHRRGYKKGLAENATRITELEALCLNALYHHQGASSAVGHPIRKALGIGEFDRLTEAQLNIIHNLRAPYAATAEKNQANQWQLIETASGRTVILGFVPHSIGGYVCPIVRDKEDKWANTSCAAFSEVNPTHWMPLPPSPAIQAEGKQA